VPIGSIMLVSDMPLQRRGIKDRRIQVEVYAQFMDTHIELGMNAVKTMQSKWGEVMKRLHSEW
jgi:AMP nucleosidase